MISKNGLAVIAPTIVIIFGMFGIDVTDNMVLEFVGGIMQAVSVGMLIYNQWARRDTTGFFFKK